jgi:hypothetical protein
MLWGEYDIRLFEARTGRPVATTHVRGADTSCEFLITVLPGTAQPPQISKITESQLRTALGRYIG